MMFLVEVFLGQYLPLSSLSVQGQARKESGGWPSQFRCNQDSSYTEVISYTSTLQEVLHLDWNKNKGKVARTLTLVTI